MPGPLEQAGAYAEPTKYAPIFTGRFFTGLWTHRNPLRDAATPYLYEKFYSATRFDSIIDGSNSEVSARLTLVRRPGHSPYNSQTFPALFSYYEFRRFSTVTQSINVMADAITQVFDATGPSTKLAIFTKSIGAGPTYFQSVGNALFMGNGLDQVKWVNPTLTWSASTNYNVGDFIVDPNNNLQQITGVTAAVTNVLVSLNTLTIRANNNFIVGAQVTLSGIGTATFLNGQIVVITSASATQFTANFTHADYASTPDTGTATASSGSGTSGISQPTWPTTLNNSVADGNLIWTCRGNSVQLWGIKTPTSAPSVANTALPAIYPNWAANTFYSPSLLVVDTNNNLELLITGGTTGAVQPTWAVGLGANTTDNTAVWKNRGQAAWQAGHNYAINDVVAVTYTVTIFVPEQPPDGGGDVLPPFQRPPRFIPRPVVITYNDFFICTTPGTSGGSQPTWASGVGTTVQDNTMQWTNSGKKLLWTDIGANALVSTASKVFDSNGNVEAITVPGKSGGTAPTWQTVKGNTTVDNAASWINQGAAPGTANTGAWRYGYAFKNPVTKHVSTISPLSISITQAANSYITLQGGTSGDPQAGLIEIYRTLQGGGLLFFLAEIPMPTGGVWIYQDANPDSVLNQFVQGAIANDPPPAGIINLAFHLNRIFGSVGNVTYYSNGPDSLIGSGNESFAGSNTFTWPSNVIRHLPTSLGLLVFTLSDVYIILGQGTASSPLFPAPFLHGIGLQHFNALDVNGSTIYLMTSDRQTISMDPSAGISEIGFPIGDQLQNFDPAKSYLAWHIFGSDDKALYTADGSTGWFRLNPTPAPESGMTWSPKANIVGGCKAVQSVETTPGMHQLLLSPASPNPLSFPVWDEATLYITGNKVRNVGIAYIALQNSAGVVPGSRSDGGLFWSLDIPVGPILFRDATNNTDNGSTYTAFATIGSIVLAQPGKVAEIMFITCESLAIGTRPTVGVLLGEVSGTFETVPRSCADPPQLPQSTTIFADRHYMSETQEPAFCRHLQVKFSWTAENAANELLSYTIFGAPHVEA